ncbi:MAG: hypothetical protein Q4B70_07885 [Lachnospiraceae bacterium]|nr:hypothetical protein [Lachnospiraceae bacterium]
MLFDRMTIGRKAKELGFVRDTYEKVCRLADILKFMEQDEVISNTLALKGGIRVSVTVFDFDKGRKTVLENI